MTFEDRLYQAIAAFSVQTKNEKTRLIYYANPSVQYRSMRLKSIQHARITADRVNEIVTMTKATANELGIDIFDGAAMTEARWFASHDGIHYNNWFSVGWQGGVSRMIAQVFCCLRY